MSHKKLLLNTLQTNATTIGLSLMLCSLFVACGPKSTKKQDVRQKQNSAALNPKQPPTTPKTEPKPANQIPSKDPVKPAEKPIVTETPAPKINIAGAWKSECANNEDDETSEAWIDEYNGVEAINFNLHFSDENCRTGIYMMKTKSTFVIGPASTKVPGAFALDAKIVSVELIPANQEGADALTAFFADNAVSNCAALVFTAKVATNVTSCNLVPTNHFDLVKVDGDQLKYGDCSDTKLCASTETRPTVLDTITYQKVK